MKRFDAIDRPNVRNSTFLILFPQTLTTLHSERVTDRSSVSETVNSAAAEQAKRRFETIWRELRLKQPVTFSSKEFTSVRRENKKRTVSPSQTLNEAEEKIIKTVAVNLRPFDFQWTALSKKKVVKTSWSNSFFFSLQCFRWIVVKNCPKDIRFTVTNVCSGNSLDAKTQCFLKFWCVNGSARGREPGEPGEPGERAVNSPEKRSRQLTEQLSEATVRTKGTKRSEEESLLSLNTLSQIHVMFKTWTQRALSEYRAWLVSSLRPLLPVPGSLPVLPHLQYRASQWRWAASPQIQTPSA